MGARDADRALTFLSGDAVTAEWGSVEQFRLSLSFLDAVDAQTVNVACDQQDGHRRSSWFAAPMTITC